MTEVHRYRIFALGMKLLCVVEATSAEKALLKARAVYGHYMSVSDLRSDMRHYYHAADKELNHKSAWDIIWDNIF